MAEKRRERRRLGWSEAGGDDSVSEWFGPDSDGRAVERAAACKRGGVAVAVAAVAVAVEVAMAAATASSRNVSEASRKGPGSVSEASRKSLRLRGWR